MTGIVFCERVVRTIVQVSRTGSEEQAQLAMAVLQHVLRQTPGDPVTCRGFCAAKAQDGALSRLRSAARLRVLVQGRVGQRQQLLVSVLDDAHRISCAQQSRSRALTVGCVRGPRASVLEVLDVDRVRRIRFCLWILKNLETRFGEGLRDVWARHVVPLLCDGGPGTDSIRVQSRPLCSISY